MTVRFYKCGTCGQTVGKIVDENKPMECCGEEMMELVPNTVDAAHEKHVPVITMDGNKVTIAVGSVEHPMEDEHHIEWIYIATEQGGQRKALQPGDKPEVAFELIDDKLVAAFAMCNLHGLWKADA